MNKYLTEALEMTRSLARGLQPVDAVPQGLMLALRELARAHPGGLSGGLPLRVPFARAHPSAQRRQPSLPHRAGGREQRHETRQTHARPHPARGHAAQHHSRRPGQRRGHPPTDKARPRHGPARHAASRRRHQRLAARSTTSGGRHGSGLHGQRARPCSREENNLK